MWDRFSPLVKVFLGKSCHWLADAGAESDNFEKSDNGYTWDEGLPTDGKMMIIIVRFVCSQYSMESVIYGIWGLRSILIS
jgi:hypothetical protein